MGCIIENNTKTILKCSTGLFQRLYENFEMILDERQLLDEDVFKNFINYMELLNENPCNYCFDIGDFIKDSKSVYLLMGLLEETIKRIQHELKDWALADPWKFHGELVKYKEELESQGK